MSAKNSNGEGSIFKRGDGRWVAKIQVGNKEDGKPNFKSFYGTKRKDVVEKLNDFKKDTNPDTNVNYYSSLTFDEYLIYWFTTVQKNSIKPTSYDRNESTINIHIIPRIGKYALKDLTSQIIQTQLIGAMQLPYIDVRTNAEKHLSFSSIKKAYNITDACLRYAEIHKHVRDNPCRTVIMPSQSNFKRKDIVCFTDEEIERFKSTCKMKYENEKPVYAMGNGMIFILNTGLRVGEALALRWSDIDFENSSVFGLSTLF